MGTTPSALREQAARTMVVLCGSTSRLPTTLTTPLLLLAVATWRELYGPDSSRRREPRSAQEDLAEADTRKSATPTQLSPSQTSYSAWPFRSALLPRTEKFTA